MSNWKVTWFDGVRLRETTVFADVYNVASAASGQGVHTYAIIKMEALPT